MTPTFWYLFNALVVIFFMWLISKKYGTLLNPIGVFGAFFLILACAAPIIFQNLGLFYRVSVHSVAYTSVLCSIYFAALGIAFAVRGSPFKKIFDRIFRFIRPFELKEEVGGFAILGMLCQFLILFVALMIASHSGLMWITNPRLGYTRRAGVGVIWSLCQATLFLTYLCVIYRKAESVRALYGYTLVFTSLAWFLGSKGSMLAYFVLALVYQHVRIKPVAGKTIVFAGVLVLGAVLALQLYQGTAQSFIGTITYFDYFSNSALFIDRFKDFGLRYGAVTLSNIWFYVPRGLYHAKPFVYGPVVPDAFLFPGAAEDGYTPGLMPWVEAYSDFGLVAVFLYGLFTGFAAKGAYELFLERKDIQSMMLLGQIGFIYCFELFGNAPFFIFLIWLMAEIAFIRILSRVQVFSPYRFTLLPAREDQHVRRGAGINL